MEDMQCINTGYAPENGLLAFDEIYSSMDVIFQLFTWDGWQDVLFKVQDAAMPGQWVLFLFVIITGSVLILNLYPAVISVKLACAILEKKQEEYAEMQSKENQVVGIQKEKTQFEALIFGFQQIAEEDRQLVKQVETARTAKTGHVQESVLPPLTPTCPGFSRAREILDAETGPVAVFIYWCIFANIIVISARSTSTPLHIKPVIENANKTFACMFIFEAFLKIAVYGPIGSLKPYESHASSGLQTRSRP